MTVWFTSDSHFGHGGALGLFRRPFASVSDMNEAMIARWNERVALADTVWHLGDVAVRLKPSRLEDLVARLSGTIHLLLGNNDTTETAALSRWASVQHYAEITEGEARLVLGHYPLRSWNGMHRGALNLHGHSHGRLAPLPRQSDVGVDGWNFAPVTLAEIRARMGMRRTRSRPPELRP